MPSQPTCMRCGPACALLCTGTPETEAIGPATQPYDCPAGSLYQRAGVQLCVMSQGSAAWSDCSAACSDPALAAADVDGSTGGPWGMASVRSADEQAWLYGLMVERAAGFMPLGGSDEAQEGEPYAVLCCAVCRSVCRAVQCAV